jgi:hypothetical protein
MLRRMRLCSQSDLARAANVATSAISHIKTGKTLRLKTVPDAYDRQRARDQ